jgi:hypothetical protein
MHRFAPSHCTFLPTAGLSAASARQEAEARDTRCSWALVILLSLATVTVALSTSVAPPPDPIHLTLN